jgi:hypothetical protein
VYSKIKSIASSKINSRDKINFTFKKEKHIKINFIHIELIPTPSELKPNIHALFAEKERQTYLQ